MPFTLAHPAGALPLRLIKRGFFSTTGLVAGSMAPDYEYFLKQQPSPTLSETVWGSLLFNLPLAIIVALIFHLLVKRPLIQHLPQPYDQRFSGYAQPSFLSYLGRHWPLFLFSVLLGIGSHHLLDWMTNPVHGPFRKTFITEIITIGPIRDRPLVFVERFFEVTALIIMSVLLLRTNKPGQGFSSTDITSKVIFWGIMLIGTSLLVLWEWQEVGGIDSFAKGITTLLWAACVSLVAGSVVIRFTRRVRLVR